MTYDNQGVTFKDITTTATNTISTASDFSVSIGKTTEPLHPTSVTEVSVSFIDAETTKPPHPINKVWKRGKISVKEGKVLSKKNCSIKDWLVGRSRIELSSIQEEDISLSSSMMKVDPTPDPARDQESRG